MSSVMAPTSIGFDASKACIPIAPLLVWYALEVLVLRTEVEDAVELLWKDDDDTEWPLFPTPCECELLCEIL